MSKPRALIGASGFVGGNLKDQVHFDVFFDSKTIEEALGKEYSLLVSAAPSAVKWKANKFPEEDRAMVDAYIEKLMQIRAEYVVSISTCDVYATPIGVDEDTDVASTLETLHPYGKHRFLLEEATQAHFPKTLIVRLPALFGQGLKKNVIFDFMHNNMLEAIHSEGSFQFYNLQYLWRDIEIAREHGLSLLNITTEPVTVAEIARVCFGKEFTNVLESKPASYDIRSKHAELFGGKNGYMYTKTSVLEDITKFVTKTK
jgi:nucleoside-diphosphate-sugar epimerase